MPNLDGTVTYVPGLEAKEECQRIAPDQDSFTTSFVYRIRDTAMSPSTDTATVTVTVTCIRVPPIANPDVINTNEDSTGATINALMNDEDPENPGAPLELVSVDQPDIGSITYSPDGTVTYVPGLEGQDECRRIAPNAGYTEIVSYTIKDADDQETAQSTIIINVGCNRGAIDPVKDLIVTDEDSSSTVNVLVNDIDPEGDATATLTVTLITQPTIATLTNNNDGTVTYTPGAEGNTECDRIAGDADMYATQGTYTVVDDDDGLTDTADIDIILNDLLL